VAGLRLPLALQEPRQMSLKFTQKLMFSIFVLLLTVVCAQINVQPIPEPTVAYTCGASYQPIDFTFANDGTLYSTDNQLLFSWKGRYGIYDIEGKTRAKADGGFVFHYKNNMCTEVVGNWGGVFGITTTLEERICFTHVVFPDSFVTCWNENSQAWQETIRLNYSTQINGLITLSDTNFWLLYGGRHDQNVPIEIPGYLINMSPKRFLGIFETKTLRVVKRIDLPNYPQFVTEWQGDLYMTTLVNDIYKVVGGKIFVKRKEGNLEDLGPDFINEEGFAFPTGIVAVNGQLLVADYQLGELKVVSLTGNILRSLSGLRGPMSVKQAPSGDICIAEMLGGRISCYSLASLGLE
jgi:hypothetical protein